MAVFRVIKDKENPYIMLNKYVLYDRELSYKAKGILNYCLSRPDNWEFYEEEIAKHSTDGLASVKTGLKELIEKGYIVRQRKRDELGKFKGYEYLVYEVPHIVKEDSLSATISPSCDFPTTDNPLTGNPTLENPSTENRMLLNNDNTNYRNKLNKEDRLIDRREKLNKIEQAYFNTFHRQISANYLQQILKTLDKGDFTELIIYALEVTKRREKEQGKIKGFNYTLSILESWINQGYKAAKDVKENEEKKELPEAAGWGGKNFDEC